MLDPSRWATCYRYNAIAYVPYQLERLLCYGLLLCCNSFLVSLQQACQTPAFILFSLHCITVGSSFRGLGALKLKFVVRPEGHAMANR